MLRPIKSESIPLNLNFCKNSNENFKICLWDLLTISKVACMYSLFSILHAKICQLNFGTSKMVVLELGGAKVKSVCGAKLAEFGKMSSISSIFTKTFWMIFLVKDLTNRILFSSDHSFWEHIFWAMMRLLRNGWSLSSPLWHISIILSKLAMGFLGLSKGFTIPNCFLNVLFKPWTTSDHLTFRNPESQTNLNRLDLSSFQLSGFPLHCQTIYDYLLAFVKAKR